MTDASPVPPSPGKSVASWCPWERAEERRHLPTRANVHNDGKAPDTTDMLKEDRSVLGC